MTNKKYVTGTVVSEFGDNDFVAVTVDETSGIMVRMDVALMNRLGFRKQDAPLQAKVWFSYEYYDAEWPEVIMIHRLNGKNWGPRVPAED